RRRHTRFSRDWSSDVCSSDLSQLCPAPAKVSLTVTKGGGPRNPWRPERAITRRSTAASDAAANAASSAAGIAPTNAASSAAVIRSEERRVGKGEKARKAAYES